LPAQNQENLISTPLTEAASKEYLHARQNPDGGWGYHPGAPGSVEATSWALQVLCSLGEPAAPVEPCERAARWLLAAQLPSGAWPAFPGQRQGCWTTSLAAWALHAQGGAPEAVERALHWLVKAWPAEGTVWWRVKEALRPSRIVRQQSSLRGWSWTPGTASWVEPTAYALLFFRSLPPDLLTRQAARRRSLAERMLYDRMCPGGGWNSGNPQVYGVAGVPRILPTAWALLALADQASRKENQLSVAWLERNYGEIRGAASLALAHRCLAAYGRELPPLAPALTQLYARHKFFENTLTAAWVALATSSIL
jgi:hypothetical protein